MADQDLDAAHAALVAHQKKKPALEPDATSPGWGSGGIAAESTPKKGESAKGKAKAKAKAKNKPIVEKRRCRGCLKTFPALEMPVNSPNACYKCKRSLDNILNRAKTQGEKAVKFFKAQRDDEAQCYAMVSHYQEIVFLRGGVSICESRSKCTYRFLSQSSGFTNARSLQPERSGTALFSKGGVIHNDISQAILNSFDLISYMRRCCSQ